MRPGDVIVHNDPYRGGLHTPEHTFFKPIFVDDRLMGYAVAIGHVSETGGSVPGGFACEATEIFHEGLRVPPVKIKRGGEDVGDVWKLLLANVRTPRQNHGDYRALISAVDLGEARIADLIRKHGRETFLRACDALMDNSEARMRAELAAFPDGKYSFADFMEDDGIDDRRFHIRVTCFVQGDEIVVDFAGSDPQAKGAINATLGVTWSACYSAILHLTDPSIPKNSGCFRPIKCWPRRDRGQCGLSRAQCRRQHRDAPAHHLRGHRGPWPRPCPSGRRPPTPRPPATSCSAAPILAPASTMSATTSCRWAGAGGRSPTATTRSTVSAAIAA